LSIDQEDQKEDQVEDLEPLPDPEPGGIVLAGRYRIMPGSPLSELDQPGAAAVLARDERNPNDLLFARVCSPDGIPRVEMMDQLRALQESALMRPLEWGPVDWPGSDQRRFAVVFQRPDHGPLMPPGKSKIKPLPSDDLSRRILGPIILTLGYMKQRGLTHRAIRPDNIYYTGPSRNSVILGDCVTAPPASQQPVLFETIESSMTAPNGRGRGLVCDDFYALGATMLVLSMGEYPAQDMDDDALIAAKIAKGSYGALMAGRRPPFGLRELLRGMLSDDPMERWGLEELEQWLGGSLRRSVQQHQKKTVDRSFQFAGREFHDCRVLAQAFGRNWESAYTAIRNSAFDKWLQRSAPDPVLAEDVSAALQADADARSGPNGRLVARICMMLDPTGPIRYKGLSLSPDGLGTTLTSAFYRKDQPGIQLIAECISTGTMLDWFATQSESVQATFEAEQSVIKNVQQLLRHSGPGYGIERALYKLNPNSRCLSPVLCGKYVALLRHLMATLEQVVADRGSLPSLVDRHLAAFIASHISKNIDRTLATLEGQKGDSIAGKLGMLNIFARLQAEFGPEGLPYLTEWLARELEPGIKRFSSKKRRRQIVEKLENVARGGDLVALKSVIDNDNMLRQDEGERRLAMRELAAASRQIALLQSAEFQHSARRTGWQIAAGISMCVAFAAMSVVAFW
jgi:hypothetical protein